MLLPKTDEEEALRLIAKINQAFEEQKCQPREQNFLLSISLGYATKTREDQTISEILKTAEEHMYRRKLLEHQSIRSTLLSTIKELPLQRATKRWSTRSAWRSLRGVWGRSFRSAKRISSLSN